MPEGPVSRDEGVRSSHHPAPSKVVETSPAELCLAARGLLAGAAWRLAGDMEAMVSRVGRRRRPRLRTRDVFPLLAIPDAERLAEDRRRYRVVVLRHYVLNVSRDVVEEAV